MAVAYVSSDTLTGIRTPLCWTPLPATPLIVRLYGSELGRVASHAAHPAAPARPWDEHADAGSAGGIREYFGNRCGPASRGLTWSTSRDPAFAQVRGGSTIKLPKIDPATCSHLLKSRTASDLRFRRSEAVSESG